MQPHTHLAYAPRGAGLVSALFYVVQGENVYGWYIGVRDYGCTAAYFMLERYYSPHATIFFRSGEDDVYGGWIEDFTPVTTTVRCPVPESVCHELERLQSAFVKEWLFYPDDAHEVEAYRKLELPVQPVNVQADHFNRFDQSQPTWIHASAGIDLNVISYLRQSWPLDDRETPPAA